MTSYRQAIPEGTSMTAVKKKVRPHPTYSPNEYIKVVPLHSPEPSLAAPAAAHLMYSGGPLLTNVQFYTVFWGKKWSAEPGAGMAAKLNAFYKAILVSPLIDQLAEYSVPGKSIGHGTLVGSKVITANAPAASVTDSTTRTQLKAWIGARTVPATTANTLYFIYLDPGIASIMGGSKSCSSYCGYHDAVGKVYYAVMPYPSCAGCLGGLARSTRSRARAPTNSAKLSPIPFRAAAGMTLRTARSATFARGGSSRWRATTSSSNGRTRRISACSVYCPRTLPFSSMNCQFRNRAATVCSTSHATLNAISIVGMPSSGSTRTWAGVTNGHTASGLATIGHGLPVSSPPSHASL